MSLVCQNKKKHCKKCDKTKQRKSFYKASKTPDGLMLICKECSAKAAKEWRKNNKEAIKVKNQKRYYKDICATRSYNNGRKRKRKNYKYDFPEHYYSYQWHLTKIRQSLKNNDEKSKEILKCDILKFKEYITSIFEDGMSFENFGEWVLTHKQSISKDMTKEDTLSLFKLDNFTVRWRASKCQ